DYHRRSDQAKGDQSLENLPPVHSGSSVAREQNINEGCADFTGAKLEHAVCFGLRLVRRHVRPNTAVGSLTYVYRCCTLRSSASYRPMGSADLPGVPGAAAGRPVAVLDDYIVHRRAPTLSPARAGRYDA